MLRCLRGETLLIVFGGTETEILSSEGFSGG